MRIAIAQINSTVGDIEKNADKIINYILKARDRSADIVVFPELALSGYPPEDLLLKKGFLKKNRLELKRIIDASKSIFVIVGFPNYNKEGIFNAAALIYNKRLIDVYHKIILPSYGVFDEKRYFHPGGMIPIVPLGKETKFSVNICEDIWHPLGPHRAAHLSGKAKLIINISASPYHAGKILERQKVLKARAVKNNIFVCYCNLVGGQDELVFDGGSLIFGPKGNLLMRAPQFKEDLIIADLDLKRPKESIAKKVRLLKPLDEIYSALVMGLKDYVCKNGFEKVVLGISGGIDSALTAKICCDALGHDNVVALSMPSKFTSTMTKKLTKRLSRNLGIRLINLPISSIYKGYLSDFKKEFKGRRPDITEENLQARIRGNMLMALSNKFGWLVIGTGNKSEISVGYCTLYGDMVGGFAVLKDVPKTLVYKLSEYINRKAKHNIIPRSIITRAPTAELKKGQRDQDVLPAYPVLDKILYEYVERDKAKEDIVGFGFNKRIVNKVISMVDKNEYKRRQSPPGVKITPKAFGKDRRMPLVNRFS